MPSLTHKLNSDHDAQFYMTDDIVFSRQGMAFTPETVAVILMALCWAWIA